MWAIPQRGMSALLRRGIRFRRAGLVAGEIRSFLVFPALRGGRRRDLPGLPDGVEVARDCGALVVGDAVLLRAAHEDPGDRHPTSRDRDMPMDDELPRLPRREGEALQERERLETPRQDRLDVEGEDVVQRGAFERQESEPAESPQELFALLLRLLVSGAHARLELAGALPEPPQDVLGAPQLLLVLESVFLQEFVLRLDAFGLPRMGRPFELRPGELRIAQRLTPSSPPVSSLPPSLPSWERLPRPSWPWRPRGRPSSSPRRSGPFGRSTACVARGPSGPSHGGRPCTTGSSSSG